LIGPKIAQELLQKYDTLENVFANIDQINGAKRKENLRNGQERAWQSRQLVRLDANVPLEPDWSAGHVGGIHAEQVQTLCREFGFRQLAERLGSLSVQAAPETWVANYRTIATEAELLELVEQMQQATHVVIDTETTSIHPRLAEIVGYSFCFREGEAYYVPVRAPAGEPQLSADVAAAALRGVLANAQAQKVGQNIKYDMIVLRGAGLELNGASFDTMVADYLLDPGERSHNLDDLAKRYLNHQNITIESLIGTGKNQRGMDEVPVAAITQYAAEDADVPLRIMRILEPRLAEQGLDKLFAELEMPLIEVLAELEFNGIRIDTRLLSELSERFGKRMQELETEIYVIAEGEFNINSPKQLAELLFEKFKLPVIKKTQTGSSTDAEVLEELAKLHPLPAKITEYRQNAKLKSGFVDAIPALIHPQTGRVHTSFKQDVAATGRLSSSDPNLQNIPVRTDAGREIRSAFVPGPPGWRLLCADYSQIELRVLAHFSGDAELLRAYACDEDIHTLVAAQVYNVAKEEVTREMRRSAKAINFGVIYGQSAFGLAKSLSIPQEEAQRFIDAYFAKYPGVEQFMDATLDTCRQQGYVCTISGRRRPVAGVRDRAARGAKRQRLLPERIAINSVIQGSAADLIKLAMIRLHRRLKQEPWQAKMLLQIHDELVFEAPPEELTALREMVVHEMTHVWELQVPLKVDVKTGLNWADCE
jgi:DNA polymerase-1